MTDDDWVETSQRFIDELPHELRESEPACRELQRHIQDTINTKELNAVKEAIQISYDSDDSDYNDDSVNHWLKDDHDARRRGNLESTPNLSEPESRRLLQVNSSCYRCCDVTLSACCCGCALFCLIVTTTLAYFKSLAFAYMNTYAEMISTLAYNYFGFTVSLTALKTAYYVAMTLLLLFSVVELGRTLLGFYRAKIVEYRVVDSGDDVQRASAQFTRATFQDAGGTKRNHIFPDDCTPSTLGSTITPDDVYNGQSTCAAPRSYSKSGFHEEDFWSSQSCIMAETRLPNDRFNRIVKRLE